MARDRIGNTRKTAETLALSPKASVLNESIGGRDSADFFKVVLKKQTSLDVELSGLQNPATIELQNKNGAALSSSTRLSNSSQALATTVGEGTYFLKVAANRGETSYTLSGVAHGDRAGANRKTARRIELRTRSTSYTDFVGRSDTSDVYRFTLDQPQELSLSLANVSQKIRLSLLGKSGTVLANATATKSAKGKISEELEAGTYYAAIAYRGSKVGTTYKLSGFTVEPLVPQAFTQQWVSQFGTGANDYAYDIDVDANGNLYIAGLTEGVLQGANQGSRDAFLALTNASGAVQSTQQFGTSDSDVFSGVVLGSNGKIYTTGARDLETSGLPSGDGALGIYERSGDQLSEFKQVSFSEADVIAGADIAVDANNNVYVAGGVLDISLLTFSATSQGFVTKYNANGQAQSLDSDIGTVTSSGAATSVAVDSKGNIYVAGVTNAEVQADPENPYTGGDAFVAKYDSRGKELWFNTLGSGESDTARRLAVDSKGNVYIVGNTEGALPGNSSSGGMDAFVAKYNANGQRQWVNQFGTTALDEAQSIAIDQNDSVYVTGETNGSLFGDALGGSDAWILKYDSLGRQVASTQLGTTADDEAYGITVDAAGSVYVAGQTLGNFGSTNQGSYDVWAAKFTLEAL